MKNPVNPKHDRKRDIFIVLSIIAGFLIIGVLIKTFIQKDQYITVDLISAGGEWWWGTPPPYYWMYNGLSKGAIEYDVMKRPLVEILDIKYQGMDNRKIAWIKARLMVKKNFRTNIYTFRQSQVQVGKTITIAPNNVSMIANIIAIEGQKSLWQEKELIITGKLLKKRQWDADGIIVGDLMLDNYGQSVATVLEKSVEPADVVTTNWLGESLWKKDPLNKDITLKLKIKVHSNESINYFNYYQPVQIAQEIDIQLENMTIRPVITAVEEVR